MALKGQSIKIKDALEALMPGREKMMQEGICVVCHEPAGPKIHTRAGRDEYRISGTCEECYDAMFASPE